MTGNLHFETYPDHAGEYRWRLRAANGEVIADSAEGYTDEPECLRAIVRLRSYAPIAKMPDGFEDRLHDDGTTG